MNHKQKCEELRSIRIALADKLGIGDKVKRTPCDFKGKCRGTCPACEYEEKLLNKELLARTAAIAGTALLLTGCGPAKDFGALSGDVQSVDPDLTIEKELEPEDKKQEQINNEDTSITGEEVDNADVISFDSAVTDFKEVMYAFEKENSDIKDTDKENNKNKSDEESELSKNQSAVELMQEFETTFGKE